MKKIFLISISAILVATNIMAREKTEVEIRISSNGDVIKEINDSDYDLEPAEADAGMMDVFHAENLHNEMKDADVESGSVVARNKRTIDMDDEEIEKKVKIEEKDNIITNKQDNRKKRK